VEPDISEYDFRELLGLELRVKDERLVNAIRCLRGNDNSETFIRKFGLNISCSTLNSWLNMVYGMPFDDVIDVLGWELFKGLRINRFTSGKAAGYCSANLPIEKTVPLCYLVGATIGDGCLRHGTEGSYFVSFEMSDKSILSLIQKSFFTVFGLSKKIKRIKRTDGRRSYLLKYSNKIVYYFLQRFFNLGPRKAKKVGVFGLENLTRAQKSALLLGLYHTDGSFTKNSLRFYTSSNRLKNDIETILTGLGYAFNTYAYQRESYSTEYQVCISNPQKLVSELFAVEAELIKQNI